MTTATKLDALRESKKAYEKLLSEQGKDALGEVFTAFFDASPTVLAITWTQYTPHFNDGDACTFRVNEFDTASYAKEYAETAKLDHCEDRGDGSVDLDIWYAPTKDTEAYKTLGRALRDVEDVMLVAFGDHVRVRASRLGFDVTEHEHD